MKVREYPMMRIRVSPELKDKILQAASAESRTQNSEICHQLEKAYGLKSPHEVVLNEKAPTAPTVEACEPTQPTK